ncbi:hypothetical protein AB837_00428 [bacterium AB1]|nr:hypothetical protein AB837_00428 [bacterium AB1]
MVLQNSEKQNSILVDTKNFLSIDISDINSEDYPQLVSDYDFEHCVQKYSDLIKAYKTEHKSELSCPCYLLKDYIQEEIYVEHSVNLEGSNLSFIPTIVSHKLIVQTLDIPKEVMSELNCLQTQRSELYGLCVMEKDKIINSIYVHYSLNNKKKYDEISKKMAEIIQQKYLSFKHFNQTQQDNILNILMNAFLFQSKSNNINIFISIN